MKYISPRNISKVFETYSFNIKKDSIKLADSDMYNIYIGETKVGQIILSENELSYIGIEKDLKSDKIIYISYITIDEEHRRKKLLTKTLKWLVSQSEGKYDYIVLRIDMDSEISFETLKSIYSKYGFVPFTPKDIDEHKYGFTYKEGEDNFMYYDMNKT